MALKRKLDGEDSKEAVEDSAMEGTSTDHSSTIFVSNLPYTTTNATLQAAFSDIAPVRTAFVVYEKETYPEAEAGAIAAASGPSGGKSKGVGYVTFAVREDADNLMKNYEDGQQPPILVDGRKVRLQWATRKSDVPASASSKKAPAPRPRPSHPSTPSDPDAIRTLTITNLPQPLTSGALWKKIRKIEGAESLVWPVNGDETVANAVFTSFTYAQNAVTKLHSHIFKGSILSAALKRRVDALLKPTKNETAEPNRGGRLIVRNLPWDVTEADLRAAFTPYGPIHSIHFPTAPSTSSDNKKPLARGFAFVWFLAKKDAENALEGVNGSRIYAGLATEKANAAKGKKKEKKKKVEEGDVEEKKVEEPVVEKKEEKGRIVAVDWALSKERWLEAAGHGDDGKDADGANDEESGDEEEEEEETIGVHEEGSSGSDSDSSGSHDGDAEDDDDDKMDVDQKSGPPPPPPEGSTIFVRNVPFEATDSDLKDLFRAFGPLRYARVTMDHASGRSRGTGFACFWNLDDANKVIEEGKRVKDLTTTSAVSKPNPFTLLTADPSSSMVSKLVLQGRTLDVTVAVSRDTANKLTSVGERQRERKDARNLYLMREGVIFPSTPAAASLSPTELERRVQAFNARRALLRSNPALYISKTRLSVRQIPTFVSERGLKRLAMHAVKTFEKEVKEGKREALAEDEIDDGKDEDEAGKEKKKRVPGERKTGVKQAKLVRQADRIDPITNKGRSKGYGFLEMDKHEDSLRVLRWANNNPEVGPLLATWWKDELHDLEKSIKKQPKESSGEVDTARLNRIKEKLAELESKGPGAGGKSLLIEFSIENVNVVKRRGEKEAGGGDNVGPRTQQKRKDMSATDDSDERKIKKRRMSEPSQTKDITRKPKPTRTSSHDETRERKTNVVPEGGEDNKKELRVGGIIGKKRRERKAKRG